jgi:predicted nucleic acid-binding protein
MLVIVLNPQFACNAGLFEVALQEYRDHPALSFIDCLLTVEAEQRGEVPLYTFDKALAKKLPSASLITK